MDEYELSRREREADEALYAVDPDLAIELGYVPPRPSTVLRFAMGGALQADRAHHERMQRALGNVAAQNAVQQEQLRGPGHAFGAIVGGGLGAFLGGPHGSALGSSIGPIFGFPPRPR